MYRYILIIGCYGGDEILSLNRVGVRAQQCIPHGKHETKVSIFKYMVGGMLVRTREVYT